MGTEVYITSSSAYLPGEPVNNDEIEEVLGYVNHKPSRLKKRILKSNGIKTRHYAIDKDHNTTISNTAMAAAAGEQCLQNSRLAKQNIRLLSCATSQGDLVLPGFSSMVQAEMQLSDIEINSAHGICSCSLMALKYAYTSLLAQQHDNALVIASELTSRLFKASRFEQAGDNAINFDTEFLRWMLSDGAGALLLETTPERAALKIEWIKSFSHADAYPVCMSVGASDGHTSAKSWQDYASYAEAERAGALLIRQDVRLLENAVKLGVDGFFALDSTRTDRSGRDRSCTVSFFF